MTVPLRAVGRAWPEGLWNGAQNYSDTSYFSVSFVPQSDAQINGQHSCLQIRETIKYDENQVKCKDVRTVLL